MTAAVAAALTLAAALHAAPLYAQLLPPPKDGDIRDVYWELRNESETWLSVELKTEDGRPAPFLTFTHSYAGRPPGPPASQIEVRAYGWAPRADLVFVIDGKQTIDLSPSDGRLTSGTPSDFVKGTITLDVLQQLARAGRITGRTLGVNFELRDSQRKALAAFYDRISGRKPPAFAP
jgi:hypothetical protein